MYYELIVFPISRFLKNGQLLENTDRYAFKENVGLTFTSYSSQVLCLLYSEYYKILYHYYASVTKKF